MGTQQIYNTAAVAVGLGVMVKRSVFGFAKGEYVHVLSVYV